MLAAFDSWIFVLLLAMAALLRLLASKASGSNKRPDSEGESTSARQQDQPPARPTPRTDEEQIRKFLEALGQPTTSKPPPPVSSRSDIPPRPVAPVRPPLTTFPTPLGKILPGQKREVILPEKPVPASEDWLRKINLPGQRAQPSSPKKAFTPKVAEPASFEVRETTAPPPEPPPTKTAAEAYAIAAESIVRVEKVKTDLAVLLASPSGLRNAIILREIFGPPRGLQPLADSML
jgi:hypothetical protein